ncbi:MAG: hypothetical protein ACTJHU_11405 [Mycetocola sp.]
MTEKAAAVTKRLVAAGWLFTAPALGSPAAAFVRLPAAVVEWTRSFSQLSSPDESVWFLSQDDYSATQIDGFAWNAFETLSLEAADTVAEADAIRRFWRSHCPILLSVRDHYAYLAVRDDGAIVFGEEPEFEDTRVVASSFDAFCDALISAGTETAHITRLIFGDQPNSSRG